jgi:alpha-tubulin suppressor-like RCC1 family protein
MAGEFDFLKDLGFSPEDFKGMSKSEAADRIAKRAKENKKIFEGQERDELFENAKVMLPKFKEHFSGGFRVFAADIGASTKPAAVSVVGYNPATNEYVVYKDGKYYYKPENKIPKTEKEYNAAIKPKK